MTSDQNTIPVLNSKSTAQEDLVVFTMDVMLGLSRDSLRISVLWANNSEGCPSIALHLDLSSKSWKQFKWLTTVHVYILLSSWLMIFLFGIFINHQRLVYLEAKHWPGQNYLQSQFLFLTIFPYLGISCYTITLVQASWGGDADLGAHRGPWETRISFDFQMFIICNLIVLFTTILFITSIFTIFFPITK